jgi:Stress responsive A/B Barrel Domain
MVSHVVLFKPRPDLSGPDRRALAAAFERAVREIPTVRDVRFGQRVKHGAGYEAVAPDSADYFAIIDFDDLAGLQTYLRHPAHDELGMRFGESLASALVYDFELRDSVSDLAG